MFWGFLLLLAGTLALNAQDAAVRVHEANLTLPTYDEGAPDPNPQFDAFYGDIFPNYPYTIRTPINRNRSMTPWRVVVLENQYLSCRILPDLGGHLHGCTDRITGNEIFYSNPAIRRSGESARGEFLATGIESSFPLAHSRVSGSPVDYAFSVDDGAGRVVVEDTDRSTGMSWRVEFILRPGSRVLEQKATVYNGSAARRGYQWWVNAAVELDDPHLRIVCPARWMLPHNTSDMLPWPIVNGVDMSDVANYKNMLGLFAHLSHEPWMAIYKPKFRSGIAHYADPEIVKGKKIWIWGAADSYVKQSLTENFNSYVEMQAGEMETQPEFTVLLPGQTKIFEHYWIPFHNLGGIVRATPDAVLNLDRTKESSVTVELDATHIIKGAKLRLSEAGRPLWEGAVDLDPKVIYQKSVESSKLTVDLTTADGAVLLHHVEGEMNAAPFDVAAKNPQPVPPASNSDDEESTLQRGAFNEQRDEWVFAWGEYQRGLKRTPGSTRLAVAAGRAAVALNRYEDAIRLLKEVAGSSPEAAYYYGVALAADPDKVAEAKVAFTAAGKDQAYETAARRRLGLLLAREGRTAEAAPMLPGGLEVALLRRGGQLDAAKKQLLYWRQQDPADNLLRVEADDPAIWDHLAADPERLLNVVEQYMQIGAYDDALKLLSRRYSAQPASEKEPGTPLPQDDPLVVYFRGYCKLKLGQDPKEDFAIAGKLSTLYIFPNRRSEFQILKAALAQNDSDAVAHDLLGDLYFDSFQTDAAITEWKRAVALQEDLPALHRNLGRALLDFGKDSTAAAQVMQQGKQFAPGDVEMAKTLARIAAPATPAASGDLAGRALVASVNDAAWAAEQFNAKAFPKEKQPENVRQAYIEVQLQKLLTLARGGHCEEAMAGIENLGDVDQRLPMTFSSFGTFMKKAHFQYYLGLVENSCGAEKSAKKRWSKVSKSNEPADSIDFVFPLLAAKRMGDSDAPQRIQAALQQAQMPFMQGALLLAAGKNDDGIALLKKASQATDPFLQYISLTVLAEGWQR